MPYKVLEAFFPSLRNQLLRFLRNTGDELDDGIAELVNHSVRGVFGERVLSVENVSVVEKEGVWLRAWGVWWWWNIVRGLGRQQTSC